ncbi:uncharacterized protein PFL1_01964 [Pseudozyma flocculosa PF-1]|uniref:uncharacterized protein n=1 Tax=Pseudozyma flocculosa PF-1 TaxID=1277687 RepID=UPI00045618BB|nr:uncharacterized protein PFL1_01964 [Pseudozyma flocculosa PF-1]EPQ30438.1 hypothetical protein PFL1_01964 [Pseudozyma flocculosa PF-1]
MEQAALRGKTTPFAVYAEVLNESTGHVTATDAELDDGAMMNVASYDFLGAYGPVTLRPSNVYAKLGNGKVVKSDGSVELTVCVGNKQDLSRTVKQSFEVLRGYPGALLFGKPWKAEIGMIHFYRLELAFIPMPDKTTDGRRWIRLESERQAYMPGLPETPLDALRLTEDAMDANVEELELLALHGLDRCSTAPPPAIEGDLDAALPLYDKTDEIEIPLEDDVELGESEESADATASAASLYTVQPAETPVDPEELQRLQQLYPSTNDDADYLAERQRYRDRFQPFRLSGRPDDDSDERAQRVADTIAARFGSVGTPAEREHFKALLKAKHLAFAESLADCKQNRAVVCDPKLTAEPPPTTHRGRQQPLSPPQQEFFNKIVDEYMANNIMRYIAEDEVSVVSETRIVPKPSSEYPPVSLEVLKQIVNSALKKAGLEHDPTIPEPDPAALARPPPAEKKWRLVTNYAGVNKYMRDKSFYPGDMDVKMGKLSGKRYVFKVDGCSAFFVALLSACGMLLSTTWVPGRGYVVYMVMPFGFKISPSVFNRFIVEAFGDIFDCDTTWWMDDSGGGKQSYGDFYEFNRLFLDRCIDVGFTLSVKKCSYFHEEVQFCGHIVGQHGIRVDPERLRAIVDWPKPSTVRELMQFRGTASYLRSKVPDFAKHFAPLDELTRNVDDYDRSLDDLWGPRHDAAFLQVKQQLVNCRVVREPRYDGRPFFVHSDWSGEGIGAVLLQEYLVQQDPATKRWDAIEDTEIHEPLDETAASTADKPKVKRVIFPLAYASKRNTEREQRYPAHLGELVAAKFALDKFAPYTFGQPIVLVTDCQALKQILDSDRFPNAHARWREELLRHDIIRVEHVSGRSHQLAHGLSHRPPAASDDPPEPVETTDCELLSLSLKTLPKVPRDDEYLRIDETAERLLKRFEGDELEATVRFLLLLEMPEDRVTRDRLRRQRLYFVKDGQLWYRSALWPLRVVSRKEGRDILRQVHDREGHYGRATILTKLRLQQRLTWPRLVHDVAEFVKRCQTCQQFGPTEGTTLSPVVVISPMETWAADFVSLPLSHGINKLLVVIDYFSRFTWAFPVRSATGKEVVKALASLRKALGHLPHTLVTDGGSHFDCQEVAVYLESVGTLHHITPAYAPWVNGMVERANRSILDEIKKLSAPTEVPIGETASAQWLPHLDDALRAVNRHPMKELADHSPLQLHYGLTRYPREDLVAATIEPTVDQRQLARAFVDADRERAQIRHLGSQDRQLRTSAPRREPEEFKEGDLVLKYESRLRSTYATAAKLAPRWTGPYVIEAKFRKSYRIRLVADPAHIERAHRRRLKRFWPALPENDADLDALDATLDEATDDEALS